MYYEHKANDPSIPSTLIGGTHDILVYFAMNNTSYLAIAGTLVHLTDQCQLPTYYS